MGRGSAFFFLVLLMAACAALLGWSAPAGAQTSSHVVPQFVIVDYHPISKTRVAESPDHRPLYDYIYRVDVRNSGVRAVQVVGQVTSKRPSVAVIDAQASFGVVDHHEIKASEDTITVRAGKFFDRRLDRKIRVNNRWRFEEEGTDPDDDRIAGLLQRTTNWLPELLDLIYNLKFSLIFDWRIQSRPDATAPVISAQSPTGTLRQSQPLITASYSDTSGTVATAGVVLSVDGVNVTSQATVGATSVAYRPSQLLAEGNHDVALTVPDNSGNVASAHWSFSVDTVPPVISDASPIDTLSASPAAAISVRYADAVSGVDSTQVHLTLDGQDVTALANVSSTGLTYQPPVRLADGSHAVALQIADAAGNPASLEWSFSVDASGPQVSALVPANGAELGADVAPRITADFVDTGSGVNVSSVRLSVDGLDVTAQAQITTQGVIYTASAPLVEGNHGVNLRAADTNGNVTETAWTFVTRSAPTIGNAQPSDVILNAGATVVISAQYQDAGSGIDVSSVRLTIDGIDFTSEAQVAAAGVSLTPTVSLPQGLHVVSLTVADRAGNSSASMWRFTIDTGLPIVDEQQPRNTLVNTSTPVISATYADTGVASSATGIDHARTRLFVNGQDVTSAAQVDTTATPHRISYTPAAALAQGNQTIKLVVADRAGNEIESVWSFTIDVEGPAIADVLPADGASFAADALLTISGSFVDAGSGINVASTRIELDGQDTTAQSSVTTSGFSRTFTQPLSEGSHSLSVVVRDAAGNVTSRSSTFTTASAPVVSAQAPRDTFLPGGSTPTISASLSDVGAGIDAATIRLFVNGTDVTAAAQITANSVTYLASQPLADGEHTVRLLVTDRAGNSSESQWQFGTATSPEITATAPRDVVLPPGSRPTISANFADARVGVDAAKLLLIVNDQDVTAQATISASGITYTPAQALPAGPYTVYLEVRNRTNASATALWGFDVAAEKQYAVEITSPSASITVSTPRLEVSAHVVSNGALAQRLTLNGQPMRLATSDGNGGVTFVGTAALQDGANTLSVTATFDDGATRTVIREVTFDAPPRVRITSPSDKAVLGRANPTSPGDLTGNVDRPVTIQGTVSRPVVSLLINQQAAQLLSGGTEFRFDNFFLREGVNMITAVATDSSGRVGSSAITVSVDQTAPILTVEAPIGEAVTSSARIDVRGMVNDAVEGLLGAPEPAVLVNGQPAQVFDRYYLATDIPLQIGENTLTVIATDQFGTARTRQVHVSRIGVGSDRLTVLSGNHQSGAAVKELPQPLVVVALNSAGEAIPNLPIHFDVTRGTGWISTTQGQPTRPDGMLPARNLVVDTDAAGQAQVWVTLGKQSGPGANVVTASHATLVEEVTFVATTQRGAVAKVLADTGINQFAETGSQPLELLSVVVRDREDNLLPNVPIVFRIEEGDAFFSDAGGNRVSRIVLNTDKNGLTALRPTLGTTPGLVRIRAQALRESSGDINNAADLVGDATYLIQVKQAQDGPASFNGYLYTDKGEPLPGVRVSIARTSLSATSDGTGAFELTDIPPGRIDLFVDGRTSNHLNKIWPSLHFESYIVRGQRNQLAHPIYLPPLLMTEAKVVGGDQDVILTMPGLQGFQMKVKANSVTFPDGSRTGTLVVSPVTADRLPMPPPTGGALFGVPAWTIQPAGTRFDPPIEVQMPNSTAQPAGDNLPVVQWDHDLGQFVPMGRATVTEDGAYLVTDAGSGVTKAGWGGLCVYDPDKCGTDKPRECSNCQKLDTSEECPTCRFDPEKDGQRASDVDINLTVSWDSNPVKLYQGSLIKKLAKFGGLEISFKGKIAGTLKESQICCSYGGAYGGTAVSSNLQLGGDLELEAKWNWLKGSSLFAQLLGTDPTLGAFTKLKVFAGVVGVSNELFLDTCSKTGSGQIRWAGGLTFSLIDATFKGELWDQGRPTTPVEITALDVGAGGATNGVLVANGESARAPQANGEWSWFAYLKIGEYKYGNFKFSLVNLTYSDAGAVHEVAALGAQ